MNGLPPRSLTPPDADAPLMTPRSASYFELGFSLAAKSLVMTKEADERQE